MKTALAFLPVQLWHFLVGIVLFLRDALSEDTPVNAEGVGKASSKKLAGAASLVVLLVAFYKKFMQEKIPEGLAEMLFWGIVALVGACLGLSVLKDWAKLKGGGKEEKDPAA